MPSARATCASTVLRAAILENPVARGLRRVASPATAVKVLVLGIVREGRGQAVGGQAVGCGKLREGQSTIRQGSVTRGVTFDDHQRLYLTAGYGYAEQILQRHGVAAQMVNVENQRIRILQDEQKKLVQQM